MYEDFAGADAHDGAGGNAAVGAADEQEFGVLFTGQVDEEIGIFCACFFDPFAVLFEYAFVRLVAHLQTLIIVKA